jgi:hypothetical protein
MVVYRQNQIAESLFVEGSISAWEIEESTASSRDMGKMTKKRWEN